MRDEIWEIKTVGKHEVSIGIFSTKGKALKAILLWTDNITNPYKIRTNIKGLNKFKGNDFVYIDYVFGGSDMLFVHTRTFNNGSGLTLVGGNLHG